MLPYFGDNSCFPRLRLKSHSKSSNERRKPSVREKRKRIISEPIPIETSSAVVDKLLGFKDNNNMFSMADAGSFSESPCHRGFNRLFISETSSIVTEYQNGDDVSADDSVFVTPRDEPQPRRNSICAFIPPKPPRMRQKRAFICQNRGCKKTEILLGRIQVAFKSCNFCFTHYCSAKCQNESSAEHLKVCFYGKIDWSLARLSTMLSKGDLNLYLSRLACDKYMTRGRGCLFIVLSSKEQLDEIVEKSPMFMQIQPLYSSVHDVERCCVSNRYRKKLLKTVASYDTATKFVVNVAIVVGRRVPNNPVPRMRDVTVRKIITIDLHEDVRPSQKELLSIEACLPPDISRNQGVFEEPRRKSI